MHRIRSSVYARRTRHAPHARRTKVTAALAALLAVCATLLTANGPAQASPPAPPSAAEARTQLGALTERTEGSMDGYDRDKFPHWSSQGDNCNTREAVLKRDGDGVETGSDCYPTSGSWFSEYDGETWTEPSDVDIDHLIPLAEAWRSGASGWTQDQREGLANDLDVAQLIAVTDNVNQSKGDKDPADWMPPSTGYHCTYARMWVWVKHTYDMTVDAAEKQALSGVLTGC
ncbi:HNH endonuclease family protein [Streptomyces sp. N2-109]|uniref:HNH endonuclease family protein n=1 Tax=Streptomyces gossypii TaxID=2883101 RepID=A0ABT2JR93_9ACTN|nr:HNH endonuclease family protein [Streptomyces gossypii]MCT2590223.1 HNH endonuclease family protein [Streptomyces gossypii]